MTVRQQVSAFMRKVYNCLLVAFISLLVTAVTVWYLYSVDGEGDDMPYTAFTCSSNLELEDQMKMSQKGLAIDDATFDCPGKIPKYWPHTGAPVKALRLFRTAQPGWDVKTIAEFHKTVASYLNHTGAKVLVGTQITCDELEDDVDWAHTVSLLKLLSRMDASRVLGLAVGNELDQLASKQGVSKDCVATLWDGYLVSKLHARMEDVRKIKGFEKLPVTTVFTAGVVWDTGAAPFKDTPDCKVNTFLTQILKLEPNWVFTFNFYPYFDPTIGMDQDGKHCSTALEKCKCFDSPECLNILSMQQTRNAMTRLTGDPSARLWVGEVGWSAPQAETLHTAMEHCAEFSGYKMLYEYYRNFIAWDLTIPESHDEAQSSSNAYASPEIVFWFSVRDSANFGVKEHFGLIETCDDSSCKLSRARAKGPTSITGLRQSSAELAAVAA
mmetsp:Transcript_9457/g.23576  ORF Transcript_9457/g.23576 Transcript_9457/m.23576 type:complete len:440 (-) Transcript_9457:31-1350(-)